MALSRSFLKGMGLTDEQIGAIIDAHTETVDGLKKERDSYKAEAKENADAADKLKSLTESDWEGKYREISKEYDDYKKSVADKEKLTTIKAAYQKLLTEQNVGEKHIDSIMRVTDFSDMKIGADGKLDGEDKLIESIKSDWSGFIPTASTKGADVDTPPNGQEHRLTKADIYKKDEHGHYVMSAQERQKSLLENNLL